jgi:hypothetical protein
MDEETFEHGEDVLRLPQHALEAGAAAVGHGDDREIARTGLADALAVEDERDAGDEERLADDELAALRDLDDDAFYIWRKRRIVTAEPAAPRSRPVPIRINAFR